MNILLAVLGIGTVLKQNFLNVGFIRNFLSACFVDNSTVYTRLKTEYFFLLQQRFRIGLFL